MSRFKYWLGDDGVARIRKEDIPLPWKPDVRMAAPPAIGIHIGLKMNPEYYEFKAEILRVTGKKHVMLIIKDEEKSRELDDYETS